MKNNLLLFLVQMVFVGFVTAQAPSVTWGDDYKSPKNTQFVNVIGQHNSITYTLRLKYKTSGQGGVNKAIIEAYDANLKKTKVHELDLKYKGKLRNFEDVVLVDGRLYLLTSFYNKKSDKNYLFVEDINSRTLKASQSLYIISEIPSDSKNNTGNFSIAYDRDTSNILVYAQWPYDKGESEEFQMHVLNSRWKEQWKKKARLPYNDDKYSIEDYKVDANGNVYIMGIIYENKGSRLEKDGKPTYLYNILSYRDQGETKEEYKIRLKDKFITDLTFEVANSGDIVCAGFYSDQGVNSVKGTYYLKVNTETKAIYNENVNPFDFEVLTANMSQKKKKRAAKAIKEGNENKMPELEEFDLDRLILRSDGGAILIGEQYYVQRISNFDPYYGGAFGNPWGVSRFNRFNRFSRFNRFNNGFNNMNQDDFRFTYNDILVVNINPDGSIAWTTNIAKSQYDLNRNGNYLSYALSITNDKLHFVFNDSFDNYDAKGLRYTNNVDSYSGGSRSVVTLASVDAFGALECKPLFYNKNERVITMPQLCQQIGKDEMILFGEYRKSYKFARLKF